MRLPADWVMVAETVGFDTFLALWRRISADVSLLHDGGQRMPKLRSYEAWTRRERDRYIMELARQGKNPAEVTRAVARNWREHLDPKHVAKIMRSARQR